MNNLVRYSFFIAVFGLMTALILPSHPGLANAQAGRGAAAAPETDAESAANLLPGSAQLINPETLVNILQSPKAEKPLILNIGPHLLYMQAHIPGAEFMGPSFGFAGNGISAPASEAAAP